MNKTVLIAVVAAVVIFLGLTGGGFFLLWSKIAAMDAQYKLALGIEDEQAPKEAEVEAEGPPAVGVMFPLDAFIVNLAGDNGKRYLRTTIQLELAEGQTAETVNQRLAKVRDVILMILPTKEFEEIRSVEGKTALRQEILQQLNTLLAAEVVANLYFTEFVIQ
jgi:flagellar FliL protein